MKHYLSDTDVSKPKEVFIVLSANLEYNDYTYDTYGEAVRYNSYYSSLEEAKRVILMQYKNDYGDLKIYEIEEMFPDSAKFKIFIGQHGDSYSELEVSEFITFLENSGATKEEIHNCLPQFFSIKKLVKTEL